MAGETLRAKLIADVQQLDQKHPGLLSREFYRKHGSFSEREWRKTFRNFREFLYVAGLRTKKTTTDNKQTPYVGPDAPEPQASEQKAVLGETVEHVGQDKINVSFPKTRIHTLPELLAFCEVDHDIWEVERWECTKWEMAGFPKAVGESGNWSRETTDPIITPLYRLKATLVRNKSKEFAKNEIAAMRDAALSNLNAVKVRAVKHLGGLTGNLLEINIPDLHAGKLAWNRETGYKDYDTNIALDVFQDAVDALIARNAHIKFDKVLFVVGNDMQNADTLEGNTTGGTRQDNDSRYYKTFVKLRNKVIDVINQLREIAPVYVMSCPGNHDKLSAWHLADSLKMRFHGYEDVEVNCEPKERKYFQWGEVMLMFTHGNTGKKPDYPLTMAQEEKQMWADTTFRECHTGHIHQTMVQEYHGVRVRTLPALCEPDAWHAANNYVGNIKTAESYAWNNILGLINMAFYNAD